MDQLSQFIQDNPDPRTQAGIGSADGASDYRHREIQGVCRYPLASLVSGHKLLSKRSWRVATTTQRLDWVLGTKQRLAVLAWLEQKNYWDYRNCRHTWKTAISISLQSYYELFHQAELVGKKTQSVIRKRHSVGREKTGDYSRLEAHRSYWIRRIGVVYRWWVSFVVGDVTGYVWGKTNQRIEVPVVNERQRQTYWSFELPHTRVLVKAYTQGNSESTIEF